MVSKSPLRLVSASPPTELSDAALLARCAEGDAAAARGLVRRFQADVVRFLSRMLGAHDPSVDDLTQLTFVAALNTADRFEGRASARTWVLGIAHNKARMEIRSRMRRRRAMSVLSTLRLVAPPAQPSGAEGADLQSRIQAAVLTLDPRRRAVFVLCEIEGRTCAEVAEILAAPEGTTRRWRAEARHALRPLLADLREPGTTS